MVEGLQIQTPSARGGASLYKIRFRNLATRHKVDQACKGETAFKDIDFVKREVQFSYEQGDSYVFMDLSDYNELTLSAEDLGDQKLYLTEDLDGIKALISDGKLLGIEIPPTVEMKIEDCGPSMKGASATARTKPATLTTGLVVQVPEYLAPGEIVKVDSRTNKFLGRA